MAPGPLLPRAAICKAPEQAAPLVIANLIPGSWHTVFGDDTVAEAMIDRLVHHAEIINLQKMLPTVRWPNRIESSAGSTRG